MIRKAVDDVFVEGQEAVLLHGRFLEMVDKFHYVLAKGIE